MALLDRMFATAAGRTPLWLDDSSYADALLAGGALWLDVSGCVTWRRKALELLRSDVLVLPIEEVVNAVIRQRTDLLGAMSAKQRPLNPLKAVLGDAALRAHLVELSHAWRTTFSEAAFALSCPSPRLLAEALAKQAFVSNIPAIDDDDVDAASVHMADLFRQFADAGVDGLLLTETADSEPADAAALSLYQPIINVARHYGWDLGLLAPTGRVCSEQVMFSIGPAPTASRKYDGMIVDEGYWNGTATRPISTWGTFLYASIPPASEPEAVLARLTRLRQS